MDEKFIKLNEKVINIYFDDSVKITKDFMSALDAESLKNVDRATMISFRIIVKFLHEYENLKSKDSDVNILLILVYRISKIIPRKNAK